MASEPKRPHGAEGTTTPDDGAPLPVLTEERLRALEEKLEAIRAQIQRLPEQILDALKADRMQVVRDKGLGIRGSFQAQRQMPRASAKRPHMVRRLGVFTHLLQTRSSCLQPRLRPPLSHQTFPCIRATHLYR